MDPERWEPKIFHVAFFGGPPLSEVLSSGTFGPAGMPPLAISCKIERRRRLTERDIPVNLTSEGKPQKPGLGHARGPLCCANWAAFGSSLFLG